MPKHIDRLIINSPHREPQKYWQQTAPYHFELIEGRRKAGYVIADPQTKNADRGIFKELPVVNQIRERLEKWQADKYIGATDITKKLLTHWTDQAARGGNDAIQFFFCQLEAIQTLMLLTEAPDEYTKGVEIPSDGGDFTRWCCKMATGTGKTVVMSMLIAWQTLNKVTYKNSKIGKRYAQHFLAVAPNLTVKDRLSVLHPSNKDNYYESFDIVPTDLMDKLRQVHIKIENWHQLAWDNEVKIARKKSVDKRGVKSDTAYVNDLIWKDWGKVKNIIVLNDEAHHAWRIPAESKVKGVKKEDINTSTVWIGGLDRLHRKAGILKCFDFSATPFSPSGKKSSSEAVFNWIVSDFGLNDAIESGLVKTPRVVIRDDGKRAKDLKSRLYHIYNDPEVRDNLNKKKAPETDPLPDLVINAYELLAKDWQETKKEWEAAKMPVPPVMITVANTTETSARLEHSFKKEIIDVGELCKENRLLRIDSRVLQKAESESEAIEIDSKKEKLTQKEQAELLRLKVDTVGKVGEVGEQICNVISVGMLSEGWDTKTVTQIMGLRAFSSQLLCEQVIGRGLRRVSYDLNEDGLFEPEYVNIFGVPFSFLPYEGDENTTPKPPKPKHEIRPIDEKKQYKIAFPNVRRIETVYKPVLSIDYDKVKVLELDPYENITEAQLAAVIEGKPNPISTTEIDLKDVEHRMQTVIFKITSRIFQTESPNWKGRPEYLLIQLLGIVEKFIQLNKITFKRDLFHNDENTQKVLIKLNMNKIVQHVMDEIKPQIKESYALVFDDNKVMRSTSNIRAWWTSKPIEYTEKSHVNYVVVDSGWEATESYHLDKNKHVQSWVKNDHLGFEIWYTFYGVVSRYYPDFIVLLTNGEYLVLETKGQVSQKAKTKFKALEEWVTAVNADGRFGKWHCAMSKHPNDVGGIIEKII